MKFNVFAFCRLTPVPTESIKKLTALLKAAFKDTTNAWALSPQGWVRRLGSGKAKKNAFRSQEALWKQAKKAAEAKSSREKEALFEPHRPRD